MLFSVAQAAQTPGHALSIAHKRKMDKSWQPCHLQGIVFIPLAVESLGAWHKAAIVEVKKLGSALARHTGEDESTTIRHLFQQLSIALMKGNAALLNNRNPGSGDEGDEGMGWWITQTHTKYLWLILKLSLRYQTYAMFE